MARLDNEKLMQTFLIALIFAIAYIVISNLYNYMSGFLGALTLYILFRDFYKKKVYKGGGKPWVWALIIMTVSTIAILVPIVLMGILLVDKVMPIFNNPQPLIDQWNIFYSKINELIGDSNLQIDAKVIFEKLEKPISSILPNMLGGTLYGFTNMAIMYFVLYFMFVNGKEMEEFFKGLFPMQAEKTKIVSQKAKEMIISNTIVIPLLAAVQGLFSLIGYLIFGVKEPIVMALITGVASVIPVVGTVVVWLPLSLILIFKSHTGAGIGLMIYSSLVVANIDYVFRFMLQKKIANVHPLITVLGILIGIKIFGFVGLIFGPTLISILLLLISLYTEEFTSQSGFLFDTDDKKEV